MQEAASPEPRLPHLLPGAAGDTGHGPFPWGPGRPATPRAAGGPTALCLCTVTHRDIFHAHMRPLRGGGNEGARSRQ
jgi:hypothetical protein